MAKKKIKNPSIERKKSYKLPSGDEWRCSICDMGYSSKKDADNCCRIEKSKPYSTNSTNSTNSTPSTDSTNESKNHLILGLLSKERKPFKSIGRGLHKDVFYIGTVLDYGKKQLDAVITSDRKIYVDWGKGEFNEIKSDFGLNYRFPLFADCMDHWWSNESIKKWYAEKYKVDIKKLFKSLVELNQKYMIYEDERIHKYTALDIFRSYFFPLFLANSRTYHHAEPSSGKTNQLMFYRALSFNPITSTDFSSASIYRIIESTSGTILIDDFDNLPDEQKSAILHHIRTGYKKFKVIRADGNKNNRPYGYSSYSHLIFNNVLGLGYDTITPERLITIRLLKHKEAKDINVDSEDPFWNSIRDDLYCMALQYWKEVKDSYDSLEVDGLTSRELELIKPILAIANIIDRKIYNEILSWYKELIEQERISRDLSDDWEYRLYEELWEKVKDKNDKEIVTVFVKDIAENIIYSVADPNDENYKKTLRRLCIFVGNKLKGCVIFKGGLTDGRTRYDIYKTGIKQILESRGRSDIVESVDRVDRVDRKETPLFDQKNNVSPEVKKSQHEKIVELKQFIANEKKANRKVFLESLHSKFDPNFIFQIIQSRLLTNLPDGSYDWGG